MDASTGFRVAIIIAALMVIPLTFAITMSIVGVVTRYRANYTPRRIALSGSDTANEGDEGFSGQDVQVGAQVDSVRRHFKDTEPAQSSCYVHMN